MKNSDLFHAFNLNPDISKRVSNVFCSNRVVYSYNSNFPIAEILEDGTVLFTLKSFSKSTVKHISECRYALRNRKIIYMYYLSSFHDTNVTYKEKIESLFKSKKIADKRELNNLIEKFNDFSNYFNLQNSELINEVVTHLQAINLEYKKRAEISQEKAIQNWLSFKSNKNLRLENELLRVKNGIIETSQGVKFEFEKAKELFNNLNKLGLNSKIDKYTLSYKDENVIHIGCHKIKIETLKAIFN